VEQHIRILSVLFVLFGIVGVIVAVGLLVVGTGAVLAMMSDIGGMEGRVASAWVGGCITVVSALFGLLGLPMIVAGWGLSQHKAWSRILAIILGILALPHMPVGTALGLYAVIVMFNDETKRLLTQ
jgi:hypothetical protein